MPSLNKVILIGNLCREPELKKTASGVSVCSFSIGVSRRYKGEDGNTPSDFPIIVCWRQTAEFVCKFLHKGDTISIVGSLQTRTYDENGRRRMITEIVADEIGFVYAQKKAETKPEGEAEAVPAYQPMQGSDVTAATFEEIGDDELPF